MRETGPSVADLDAATHVDLKVYNRMRQPFVWTHSVEGILAEVLSPKGLEGLRKLYLSPAGPGRGGIA